jgi:hypothetical protein
MTSNKTEKYISSPSQSTECTPGLSFNNVSVKTVRNFNTYIAHIITS